MRYLSLQEVVSLHSLLIAQSGGSSGLRDRGNLESAVAQPEASFEGNDLYPDLASKDEQETIILDVASGKVSRIELSDWISKHMVHSTIS